MKLSDLIKRLYEESSYNSIQELADKIGLSKSFIERAIAGTNTMEKLDLLFDELTSDLSTNELIQSIKLIHSIKENIATTDIGGL